MKIIIILLFCSSFFSLFFSAVVHAEEGRRYEMPRTHIVPIKNSETGGQYNAYVKLPEDYAKNKNAKYPVIYFTDADWHIEIMSVAAEYIMKDVILVGISWQTDIDKKLRDEFGAHVSRFRDYSVKPSSNPKTQAKHQLGQADKHLNFIRNDVIKTIEKAYRVNPEERAYFGYSMGGLLGVYMLLERPSTFKYYILGSPALRGDMEYFAEFMSTEEVTNKNLNANVLISHGASEEELGKLAKNLQTMLDKRKDSSLLLDYRIVDGDHSSAFPLVAVEGVNWLLSKSAKKSQENVSK